jgi:hypothetical protein
MSSANAALLAQELLRAARALCVLASGDARLSMDPETLLREAESLLEDRGRLLFRPAAPFS